MFAAVLMPRAYQFYALFSLSLLESDLVLAFMLPSAPEEGNSCCVAGDAAGQLQ